MYIYCTSREMENFLLEFIFMEQNNKENILRLCF